MRTFASVTVVALVLVTACLPVTNRSDGSSCSDDDECASARCNQGFCSGRSCKPNDTNACDAGWKCVHSDPDVISGFFGSRGSDSCRPLCGSCPGNMHCAAGGIDGQTLCSFGKAPLELRIEVPSVTPGQPARIVAIAEPPAGRLVKCEWETGDGKPAETTPGAELTHVYEGREQPTTLPLRVTCTDDGGRVGSAEDRVELGCHPSGATCMPSACCAEGGHRCLPAPGGSVCRMPITPTLTISGPTTIARLERAEFTVIKDGGEGEIAGVTWTFSDSSFRRSGLTVSESFSEAGPATVRALVQTSLGQQIEETHALTICQRASGECSASQPCCAPLACKTSGSAMRCQ